MVVLGERAVSYKRGTPVPRCRVAGRRLSHASDGAHGRARRQPTRHAPPSSHKRLSEICTTSQPLLDKNEEILPAIDCCIFLAGDFPARVTAHTVALGGNNETRTTILVKFAPEVPPSLLSPQPSTLNYRPSTTDARPSTLNPYPSTLNPQPSTLNPQQSTLHL